LRQKYDLFFIVEQKYFMFYSTFIDVLKKVTPTERFYVTKKLAVEIWG